MRATRKAAPNDVVSWMRVTSNGNGTILAVAGQCLAGIVTHHLTLSSVATCNVLCCFLCGIMEGIKTHTVKTGHKTIDLFINRFGNTFASYALLVFACAHAELGYFIGLIALIFVCIVACIAGEIARFITSQVVQSKRNKLRGDYSVAFEYLSIVIIVACELYYTIYGKNLFAYQLMVGSAFLAVLLTDLLFFHEKELPVYISNVIGCCIALYMQIFVHFGEHWILELIDGLFLGFASAYTRFVDTVYMPGENLRKGETGTFLMNVGVNGLIGIIFYSLMYIIPPIQSTMTDDHAYDYGTTTTMPPPVV